MARTKAQNSDTLFQLRRPLYLALCGVYLLWSVMGGFALQFAFGVLVVAAMVLALPDSKRSNLIVSLGLFALGALCLLAKGATPVQWLTAVTSNGGLVALFITLPLFSILLAYNDYVGSMDKLFHLYVRRSWAFFGLASILSGIIGAVMNLGGMTLMYELLKPYRPRYGTEKQMAQALSRGNLSMSYWAPCHMSVATAVAYTGISWIELAPKGILLSAIQLCFACLCFYVAGGPKGRRAIEFPETDDSGLDGEPDEERRRDGKGPEEAAEREIGGRKLADQDQRTLRELFIVYLGLVALVALLNKFTSLAVLAIISVSAFIYPVLAGLTLKKWQVYRLCWHDYQENKLGGIVNQVLMFSSVGFFGKALEISGAGDKAVSMLNLSAWSQPSLLVMVIAFTIMLMALAGIHPVVTMIALATTLRPEILPLTPLQLAYSYLLGYSVGVTSSPFFAVALTISALNGQGPWQGMAKYNIIYSCLLILLFSLIIPLV